ncbi:hypothetical protein BBFGKLBO_02386 [Synechococcus sp. CBW1107]|jgi:hypothetical protein|uniref:sulfotransferase n=1 Tax=Synechococcus sp. CBW1107 TaxID=2789857 RepID=UPI002AD41D08|nr:sulfotransferase [Synechococcus sp. CBW1107]CAK6698098.1 hypothetical protein BBFGKLBO_02386 [Synechococcus sp. CBW1107]
MRAPIFVIGYPRSGTSFVGKLIGTFTGYPSHGEAHTTPLLQHIIHQINLCRSRKDFTGAELIKEMDLQALKDININFFREFYLQTYGGEGFIDKTPGPTACNGWAVVKSIFPKACFVACVRSPVEVYESAVQKFGSREGDAANVDFVQLAEGWVGAMSGIEKLAASPYGADLHVVSQLELRSDPVKAVPDLFRFLQVPEAKVSEGVDLCSRSRDDVLTESIARPEYRQLDQLLIEESMKQRFRDICTSTCKRWNIAI